MQRLGHVPIDACGNKGRRIAFAHQGCQGDDGQMLLSRFDLTNGKGCLAPVHLGHGDIHENQIGLKGLEQADRFRPVIGKDHIHRQIPHHLLKHHLIGAVVFGHQDPHRAGGSCVLWQTGQIRRHNGRVCHR